ncbi:MAG: response regulator, partial [Thermoanaerobaculales bacterium]|nr:response regulator [Thermoanaerobaculales bacterium]
MLKTGTAIAELHGMMQPDPPSILILDDDPFFARSVQILLEDEGRYEVAVCSAEHDAASGFEIGKGADVLIVDSELLEQSSPLARRVRQLEAGSIIVLTAHSVAPELFRI